MNEEEIKAKEAEDAAKAKEEADKGKNDSETVANLVEELKKERAAKQEAQGERDATAARLKALEDTDKDKNTDHNLNDVSSKVEEVLQKKEIERLEKLRVKVEKDFKNKNKDFSEDNDPGGLKYAAFKRKLDRINLSALTSEEDINEAFEDTLVVFNKAKKPAEDSYNNPYAATVADGSGDVKDKGPENLSVPETKLIKSLGWTEERFAKIKKAQPHYVNGLLKQYL